MKDRTSTYPGRVKLVPVEGMENTYTMSWADEPLQEGTPLNKATLLSDTVAAALRLTGEDPTVSDAFLGIANGFARVITDTRDPAITDEGQYGWLWINTSGGTYKLSVCFGQSEEGYLWASFLTAKRTLKSEVFTTSSTFTLPDSALGNVHIFVYGGGGSGGGGSYTSGQTAGGGGGGGCMAEWTGALEVGKAYAVTVGAGGKASTGRGGNSGGSSSFGTLVSAAGGSGPANSSYYPGGNGGSGGGGGNDEGVIGNAGIGSQFGSGSGNVIENGVYVTKSATVGINTNSLDVPSIAKGNGAAGSDGSTPGGGGGGYGGRGGNGNAHGGGGGGGFGASGNGGNGATANADPSGAGNGGYGAGGGGCNYYGSSGAGGSGIVVVAYYVMEVVA